MTSSKTTDKLPAGSAVQAEGSPPRPRGRPTLSNEALLDKSLDLFLELGFERTSIDAIAAAAGVAKRTIYQRYGDKNGLFKAALERAIAEWIVPEEEIRAAESDDLEQTLLKVARILVSNIMRPTGIRLMRITNAESARMPDIGAFTYHHGTSPTIAYLADLFHRRLGPSHPAMKDWREAAIAFLYLVVTGPPTVTAWGMTLDEATIEHQTCFCVHLFLYGMVPRSAGDQVAVVADHTDELVALREENRRLRDLLLASMLEATTLKEQQNS